MDDVQTKPNLNDAELVALARELATAPTDKPSWSVSHVEKKPIAGSSFDQRTSDGVQNPLWEIARILPADEPMFGGGMPEPDGHWVHLSAQDMGRAYAAGLDRGSLCVRFSWSVPSPGDMGWLWRILEGRGVVEIGAGSGYWAWQMAQVGIDVVAYDAHEPSPDNKFAKRLYHPVASGDPAAAARHPDRALLLCWPPYDDPMAANALKAYAGDTVVFVGENAGGCTADDEFFTLLDEQWSEIGESPWHVTWRCIHCSMTAYRRNA